MQVQNSIPTYRSRHKKCIVDAKGILFDPDPGRCHEQRHRHAKQSRNPDVTGMVVRCDRRKAVPIRSLSGSTDMVHFINADLTLSARLLAFAASQG
jgi:hypothetical protein